MKNIVLFSGGASSSYAAYQSILKYGKENTILLHTPTYAEHKDADRFREEISNFLDIPITISQDGRSLWQLIIDNNCLPSTFIPFCTQQLKIKQTDKFIKQFDKNEIVLQYGFDTDEYRRVQKTYARKLSQGYKTEFLVYESKIKNQSIKNIIKNEWKIALPVTYETLEHNNCIPCFKAGKKHFEQVYKYYPEEFYKAEQMEYKINHTVFKDESLKSIRKKIENTKNQISLFENDFNIPCSCWS